MSYEAIGDILKYLLWLENQGQLTTTAKAQIRFIIFVLRFLRIDIKGKIFCSSFIRKWNEDIEMRLIQPTRNGSMATEILEETLSSLMQNNHQFKEDLAWLCSSYYRDAPNKGGPGLKDAQIDELLMDWLDPLLENLKHLIHSDDLNLFVLKKEQIEELREKFTSLRNFLEITGKELETIRNTEPRQGLVHKRSEDLLTRIKYLTENAIYLSFGSWLQIQNVNIGKFFFDLLAKINHIEPEIRMLYVQFLKVSKTSHAGDLPIDLQALLSVESLIANLEELLKHNNDGSIIPLGDHQLALLHQELSFLRYFLLDPHLKQYMEPEPETFISLLMQVEVMAREGASLSHSICDGQKQDDMAKEMDLVGSNLQEILNLLKAKIRQMYQRVLKPSKSNFPQTPKLGFLDFFVQNLEELLKHRADSIAYVKNEIETVHNELALMSSFIRDGNKNPEEDENVVEPIIDAAYEAERVIDLILASHFPKWYYIMWLSDVIEKIKLLCNEFKEVSNNKNTDISVMNTESNKASVQARPLDYALQPEEEVVGFNDEVEKIINQLTGAPKELDIVSIIGMPGLGKTTLAKKVYEHPSVTRYFHVRSWYCISQVYERRDLLLSILDDVTELTELIKKKSDEDLAAVLYRSLKGKRYFIIIDDIWSIDPWNDIHNSFPDDCKGSRILFTSRNEEVALQANPRSRDPHYLRLFSKEESCELLKKKVFQLRDCPSELYKIGEQIAENCKGLPLSVVIAAGILTSIEESEDCWRIFSESLGKQVGDSELCTSILEMSYNHLPQHLKPCFLYLGAFPEDKEIPAWKLIRLWIAEGLVQKTESESLEEVAEGYLKYLIARSMVLLAKNKYNGRIKSCRIHDLLHEFSVEKAKDEKVLLRSKQWVNPEQYRHCFYCGHDGLYGWMPDDSYARSILCFPTDKASYYEMNHTILCTDLSVIPYILKLLRVLDLERIYPGHEFLPDIGLMVHLRYLAIRGPITHVPSSIENLWRLETLIIHGTRGEVKLPEALFEMAHLKHVYVNKRAAFVLFSTFPPEKSLVSGIQKLSTPVFCRGDGTTEKVLRSLKKLQKLKCIFLESWYTSTRSNQLPTLDTLTELESLNVTYHGILKLPYEFSFPSNLKKLTLSKFRVPWREMTKIGRLVPQLEVLKLHFKAFEGPRWEVTDDDFANLKVLKLESLDMVEWHISDDAFPCLEQLVLERCKKLKEIRSNLGELGTLRRIEAQWCSYSATKAIWEIQEQQQELGGDLLKVLILPSDWDSALAS